MERQAPDLLPIVDSSQIGIIWPSEKMARAPAAMAAVARVARSIFVKAIAIEMVIRGAVMGMSLSSRRANYR